MFLPIDPFTRIPQQNRILWFLSPIWQNILRARRKQRARFSLFFTLFRTFLFAFFRSPFGSNVPYKQRWEDPWVSSLFVMIAMNYSHKLLDYLLNWIFPLGFWDRKERICSNLIWIPKCETLLFFYGLHFKIKIKGGRRVPQRQTLPPFLFLCVAHKVRPLFWVYTPACGKVMFVTCFSSLCLWNWCK